MTNQTTNSGVEPNSPAVEKAIKRFHAALACTCDRTGRHQPWCRVFDANAIKDEEKSDLRIAALVLARELGDGPVKDRIIGTLRRLAGADCEAAPALSNECCAGERGPSVEQKCVTCPHEGPCPVCGSTERSHAGYLLCECPASSLRAAGAAVLAGQ